MTKKLTVNNVMVRSGLVSCNKNLIYSAMDRHGIVRSIYEAFTKRNGVEMYFMQSTIISL